MTSGRARHIRPLLLAGAGGALLLAPVVLPPYPLILLCYALVFSIACLGLNLLLGTAGLLSLGHAAYFGAGAYAGAFLYRFSPVSSFEVYLLSGVLCAAALSAGFGFICARATKIHFSILTLACAQAMHSLFISGVVFRPFGGVGWGLFLLGGGGLYIPRLTLLGAEVAPQAFIPAFYYVIALAFLGSVALLRAIDRSPFGMALRAIRDNETRAAFIGIPVRQCRWYAFILSGVFTGLAGGLYGQLARQVTPDQLYWLFSAQLVLATVLGGTRQFAGPILGAFVFVGLDEFSSRWAAPRQMVFGLSLIGVVFAFPGGLAGGASALVGRLRSLRGCRGGTETS